MKNIKTTLLLSIALMCLYTPAALAQTSFIGLYNFTGAAGNEDTWPAALQPANTQLSPMGRGPGVSPGAAANAFSAFGWTLNTEPDPNDYFAFTITMNPGFDLRLDSVTISERRSNSGPRKFVVRTSRDNYTQNVKLFELPDNMNTRNNQTTPFGAAFGAIESSSSLQIRFLAYESSNPSGTWRIDSVRIFGEVLVAPTKIKWVNTQLNLTAGATEAIGQISIEDPIGSGTVQVVRTGGTAIEGVDFTLPPGNELSIAGSQAFYSITLLNNPAATGNESIEFTLRNPSLANSRLLPDSVLTINFNIPFVPSYTIAQVRGGNTFEGGGPDSMNVNCRLFGTIYGVNLRASNNGLQYTLRDATGGIGIFKASENFGLSLSEGDSVRVMGKIGHFNGLAQLNIDSIVPMGMATFTQSPRLVTTLDEDTESDLIYVQGFWLNHLAWPAAPSGGGFTMRFVTNTDTIDVRIDNDVDLFNQVNPFPSNVQELKIIGIGGQFAPNVPRDYGYQLLPRKSSDISLVVSNSPLNSGAVFKVFPNPANTATYLSGIESGQYLIWNSVGKNVQSGTIQSALHKIDISKLKTGCYIVQVIMPDGSRATQKLMVK
jgi:hypothetical protein